VTARRWSPPARAAPYHTISDVGLIGGGQVSRPGEGSLAHNRVLFAVPSPERVTCWGRRLSWSSVGLHGTPTIINDLRWRLRRGHLVGGHDGPPNDQAMARYDQTMDWRAPTGACHQPPHGLRPPRLTADRGC